MDKPSRSPDGRDRHATGRHQGHPAPAGVHQTGSFDAEEIGLVEVEERCDRESGRIGDSVIMMFDSPFPVATPGLLRLYVEDGDAGSTRWRPAPRW